MLSNILADIRAFLFVMLLVVIMFGHALFMVLGTNDTSDATTGGITISDWEDKTDITELEGALEGNWETKFDTIAATGVTLYSMLLGDYDPDQFPTTYAYAISVVFMFIIVIGKCWGVGGGARGTGGEKDAKPQIPLFIPLARPQ